MNLSGPFIRRPVATMLLSLAIMLLGGVSFGLLPVAPLPQMDFPVIVVSANLSGASPEVMASTVATPLERKLGSIAGVTTLTSSSNQGSTRVIIGFEMGRDIDGAAREVQAAINATRNLLPSGMRSMPTYKKINPSQAPIMVLSLTSDVLQKGQLYDLASTILSQSLSQVPGVGEVQIGGSSLPAVRVELEPQLLNQYGVSLDDVRQAIANANVRRPKGFIEDAQRSWQVQANDQLEKAKDYGPLVIRYQDGSVLRLSHVAKVTDAVENRYNSGFFNDQDAVLLVINRQTGANIIQTIESINQQLPALQALMPASVQLNVAMDRSPVIKATLKEAEHTLLIAVGLVILVVYLFLGSMRATLIPMLAARMPPPPPVLDTSLFGRLQSRYTATLEWAMEHPKTMALVTVLLLVSPVLLSVARIGVDVIAAIVSMSDSLAVRRAVSLSTRSAMVASRTTWPSTKPIT